MHREIATPNRYSWPRVFKTLLSDLCFFGKNPQRLLFIRVYRAYAIWVSAKAYGIEMVRQADFIATGSTDAEKHEWYPLVRFSKLTDADIHHDNKEYPGL